MSNPTTPPSYPSEPTKLLPPGAGGGAPPNPSIPPSYPPGQAPGGGAPPPVLPAVPAINRNQLIKNYANMVAHAWIDDSYRQLLLSDPVTTLANAGLPTVSGAEVVVVENKITGVGKVEDAVDEWIQGNQTGRYLLWLPVKPDAVNLPAGGGGACAGGDSCCCCPCCCCT